VLPKPQAGVSLLANSEGSTRKPLIGERKMKIAPLFSVMLIVASISPAEKLYFLSDVQAPLLPEKIWFAPYKNEAARDSLLSDLLLQKPGNVFFLGDMAGLGSSDKKWAPIDSFLRAAYSLNVKVYAIPGNHEYYISRGSGMRNYTHRFRQGISGSCITIDSIAIVMLNSNFCMLSKSENSRQLSWYKSTMDSLKRAAAVKTVIVCTHHAPYSNSKVVGSCKSVIDSIVPYFDATTKAKLFLSGHSHNLEYFEPSPGKHFLVIGGGGGIAQALDTSDKRLYQDVLAKKNKPLYFYLIVQRNGNMLTLIAHGLKRDFTWEELTVDEIRLD
jgi:hypothetical protein